MTDAKRVPVTSYFTPAAIAAVDAEALREDRSRSVMIRILAAEGLAERRRKSPRNA